MPKVSKEQASHTQTSEGLEGRYEPLEGGYTVAFESYSRDADTAADAGGEEPCQAPHWGYVISGKVGFRFGEREEVIEAGEAYYVPPGHTPVFYAGTEVVEFTRTADLAQAAEAPEEGEGAG